MESIRSLSSASPESGPETPTHHDHTIPTQQRIHHRFPNQNPIRQVLYPRPLRARKILEANGIPDFVTEDATHLFGNAGGDGGCGDSAGLGAADEAGFGGPAGFVQVLGEF